MDEDVLASLDYAKEISRLTGLPIKMTTVQNRLYPLLQGRIDDLFPMELQAKYYA